MELPKGVTAEQFLEAVRQGVHTATREAAMAAFAKSWRRE